MSSGDSETWMGTDWREMYCSLVKACAESTSSASLFGQTLTFHEIYSAIPEIQRLFVSVCQLWDLSRVLPSCSPCWDRLQPSPWPRSRKRPVDFGIWSKRQTEGKADNPAILLLLKGEFLIHWWAETDSVSSGVLFLLIEQKSPQFSHFRSRCITADVTLRGSQTDNWKASTNTRSTISTIIRDSTGLAISYRCFRSRLMSEARDNSESEWVSV